jgi:predicted DCC family thiol-disulfide oxidoreductase YuxK
MTVPTKVSVVYDPECPVCDFYCRRVEPGKDTSVALVDARTDTTIMPEITARNWDIDQGMVVKVGDALYYGSDAIHQLSLISRSRGMVRPMSRLFRSPAIARRLYPLLRDVRNGLLKLLGKRRINNLRREGADRF